MRHDAVDILDTWYDGKISISNQHGTGFDVKISDQQTTDYYMVIGLCDPMDSKCKGTVFNRQRHLVTGKIIFLPFFENRQQISTCQKKFIKQIFIQMVVKFIWHMKWKTVNPSWLAILMLLVKPISSLNLPTCLSPDQEWYKKNLAKSYVWVTVWPIIWVGVTLMADKDK